MEICWYQLQSVLRFCPIVIWGTRIVVVAQNLIMHVLAHPTFRTGFHWALCRHCLTLPVTASRTRTCFQPHQQSAWVPSQMGGQKIVRQTRMYKIIRTHSYKYVHKVILVWIGWIRVLGRTFNCLIFLFINQHISVQHLRATGLITGEVSM
jgi:hypothetical protein